MIDISTTRLRNQLTGRVFALGAAVPLSVVLSASPDALAEPRVTVSDFGADGRSPSTGLTAALHVRVEDGVRHKYAVIHNATTRPVLVLDVVLDDFAIDAEPEEESPAQGHPVLLAGELWAAVCHPSGWNRLRDGRVRLWHCPGRRLEGSEKLTSAVALIAAAPAGGAREHFVDWIHRHGPRRAKGLVSVYTPFGINTQWGGAPTLDDRQTLHVLDTLKRLRRRGVRFDYFSLDTGWVDGGSDLKRFRPMAYPEGPDLVIRGVREGGMRLGLWFATSWASQSSWDHPPAWGARGLPPLTYRNGYPALTDYAASFCLAAPPYYPMLKDAVLYHMREHGVRLLKFDGGSYTCDDTTHGHLPGPYATERMHELLMDLSRSAREVDPGVFILWYWGLRSPFWALHGDTIFESGLFMEGSGTSDTPTLFYRDSVTLAQDQNAAHARAIPPMAKDSLGVWLADTRWGNYMGRQRWREALTMDLGRGNLLFPNLWGDLNLLEDDDVRFLARMMRMARRHRRLLGGRRRLLGDPMAGGPYGYAYRDGRHSLLFLSNPDFVAHEIEGVWLRPFEVVVLENGRRDVVVDRSVALQTGVQMELEHAAPEPDMEVVFADHERHRAAGYALRVQFLGARLPPDTSKLTPWLAVAVTLAKDGKPYRHTPYVADSVQVLARIESERLGLEPVPDARQYGNTQKAGCSWVVYRTRLARRWMGHPLRLATHAWLPPGVAASTRAYVLREWWRESARPVGDGYYADAPS